MLFLATPADESTGLASLRRMVLLDTPDEEVFDRVARLAQLLFDAPIVLVLLVDQHMAEPQINLPLSTFTCGMRL